MKYVLSQTNTLELTNILIDLTCSRCTSLMGNHYTCISCGIVHCEMFYNTYDRDYTCLDCVRNLKVKKDLYNNFTIKGKFDECIDFYTDDDIKEGPITKEEALKLLKKYTNY